MPEKRDLPVEKGNEPGNPLRSYRMSMLAHGFRQDRTGDGGRWRPTENSWLRRDGLLPSLRAAVVVIAAAAVVVLLALAVARL